MTERGNNNHTLFSIETYLTILKITRGIRHGRVDKKEARNEGLLLTQNTCKEGHSEMREKKQDQRRKINERGINSWQS